MKKILTSIFLFLMQSYDDSKQFPRKFTDSSPTCVDKRLILGQIVKILSKNVQCSEIILKQSAWHEKPNEKVYI